MITKMRQISLAIHNLAEALDKLLDLLEPEPVVAEHLGSVEHVAEPDKVHSKATAPAKRKAKRIDRTKVEHLADHGLSAATISTRMKISKSSVYRILAAAPKAKRPKAISCSTSRSRGKRAEPVQEIMNVRTHMTAPRSIGAPVPKPIGWLDTFSRVAGALSADDQDTAFAELIASGVSPEQLSGVLTELVQSGDPAAVEFSDRVAMRREAEPAASRGQYFAM